MPDTHVITNQVPPFVGHNPAHSPVLLEAVHREGAGWAEPDITALGALSGSEEMAQCAIRAERHAPILRTHDRFGHRIDEVEYAPDYHRLMTTAIEHGLAGAAWAEARPGAHVARAAKVSVWQVDAGHVCPISMTYAAVPALRAAPELAAIYEPLLTTRTYDPTVSPPLSKPALTAGMSMTEKQGGSDVRAGTTIATPNADGSYTVTGHKWFTSAPMCDVFLVLAQAPGGLTCFLLPKVLPDGTRNRMHLQRLKDKLGNKSNASSEIEYDGALAWRVGDEGRGVPTIIEMVNLTRLDCTVGAASMMRTGVAAAMHHITHRKAFGGYLIDAPLMRNVIADLAVEAEASTMVAMRMAGATDRAAAGDESEALLRRIGLAAAKFWVCKGAPKHVGEAMECLGGNGYVEDFGMARLYREAPLPGIWEGSGNVAALDLLRAMATRPECVPVLFDELDLARGMDSRFDAYLEAVKASLGDVDTIEYRARSVAENITVALQAGLLLRHGHPAVTEAFCATRLDRRWGNAYGTLPTGLDIGPIIERAVVKLAGRDAIA
jgi:putative acyl-CoA dehydrogenase